MAKKPAGLFFPETGTIDSRLISSTKQVFLQDAIL
jgi:hypothetical protein